VRRSMGHDDGRSIANVLLSCCPRWNLLIVHQMVSVITMQSLVSFPDRVVVFAPPPRSAPQWLPLVSWKSQVAAQELPYDRDDGNASPALEKSGR
jgi:hypothetical protein